MMYGSREEKTVIEGTLLVSVQLVSATIPDLKDNKILFLSYNDKVISEDFTFSAE